MLSHSDSHAWIATTQNEFPYDFTSVTIIMQFMEVMLMLKSAEQQAH